MDLLEEHSVLLNIKPDSSRPFRSRFMLPPIMRLPIMVNDTQFTFKSVVRRRGQQRLSRSKNPTSLPWGYGCLPLNLATLLLREW